jgi:molybdopterin-guanine dinucleotide biosynthesis protein A
VLAGGQSTRLGRPKWSEPLGGVPLALRAAAALAPHTSEVVLVAPRPLASELGLTFLADARGGGGPLAGLVAALEHAETRGAPGCLVLACDLPLVDADLMGTLVDAWDAEDLVVPERAGRLQPLCALWSVAALPAARAALSSDDRSVAGVVARLAVRVVDEPSWRARTTAPDPLLNVNTQADLERAAELLGARSVPGPAG